MDLAAELNRLHEEIEALKEKLESMNREPSASGTTQDEPPRWGEAP